LSVEWQSGITRLPGPVSYGCALVSGRVHGEGAIQIDVTADGALIHTITALNTIQRLPANLAETWEVTVKGPVDITTITLAGDPDALFAR